VRRVSVAHLEGRIDRYAWLSGDYRLCDVRGPEAPIVELAERIASEGASQVLKKEWS
jgi:hypothetical protein